MMRRTVLAGLMAVSLTALAGCGFQLRGLNQPTLAIPELNLNANVSPFSEEVRRALENPAPVSAKRRTSASISATSGSARIG